MAYEGERVVKSTGSYIYRMLTPDSIVPNPTNPQSFNRYSYGYNNPVKYRDPSGHIACDSQNLTGMDQAACSNPDYVHPTASAAKEAVEDAKDRRAYQLPTSILPPIPSYRAKEGMDFTIFDC